MLALRSLPFLIVAAIALPAVAQATSIGVVAPQSGPFALLGEQMRAGATAAAEDLGVEIRPIDETCKAGSGETIARQLQEAGVAAAIGFLCSESLDGSLPLLKEAGIPAITISVRWQVLMEDALKHNWPFFRMAPTADSEAEKLVDVILREWPDEAFALIEDGTIHGRELSEAIRNALEERGMKPVFTDTYRPGQEQQIAIVRRLAKAGASHVFVGGDRNDVAIIARDAAAEGIALTLLGGDAMRAADQPVPLADGVLAVALPNYATLPEASRVAARLIENGVAPEGYVLPAYAAAQVAAKATASATGGGTPIADILTEGVFDTVTGKVAFTAGHELKDNPYRLQQWNGDDFTPYAESN
ncbi:MAG TPA: branched-chain amino acid ABC transporter substrate-binding protein [Rhizobium sp.]|nr:branched-chain amino acid ABC transporter substrate-binding protein [Rhizobium sp.]